MTFAALDTPGEQVSSYMCFLIVLREEKMSAKNTI